MKCPECKSDHINKNGHRGQKQNYIGSKSVLSEHKYYSIAKDCYLGKHSGV